MGGRLWGDYKRAERLVLTIPHSCLFLPLLTKQSTPKNARVMSPLLILSPYMGDPREGRGYASNLPIFGSPRGHG